MRPIFLLILASLIALGVLVACAEGSRSISIGQFIVEYLILGLIALIWYLACRIAHWKNAHESASRAVEYLEQDVNELTRRLGGAKVQHTGTAAGEGERR